MPKEISTYFGYANGYDPQVLRLGNLSLDYANPRMLEPYIHEEISPSNLPQWATVSQEENRCITHSEEGGYSFGLGLQDLLTFDASNSSGTYKAIIGEKSSEIELIEPQHFFTESVLKSEKARLWLKARLTAIRKWRFYKKQLTSRPKFWLLIGLYRMESTTTYTVNRHSANHGIGATAPIPDPSGLAAILQLSVGGKASISSRSEITTGAKILTPKIWAAKWQLINVEFIPTEQFEPQDGTATLSIQTRFTKHYSRYIGRRGVKYYHSDNLFKFWENTVNEDLVAKLTFGSDGDLSSEDAAEELSEAAEGETPNSKWQEFDQEAQSVAAYYTYQKESDDGEVYTYAE